MVHDRITTDPNVMAGKPVIRGTRIPVNLIVRRVGQGLSDGEIQREYPRLAADDIRAAAAFAANHLAGDEIVLASGSTRGEYSRWQPILSGDIILVVGNICGFVVC